MNSLNSIPRTSYQDLDELFKDWRRCLSSDPDFSERPFIKDGIVNPVCFKKQKTKVLFISNESNIDKYDLNDDDDDIRENFKDYSKNQHDEWGGKLRERVSCLYQVITDDYSKKPYEVSECFAFMNLNKTGGGNTIDNRIVLFCERYGKWIQSEIDMIHPDLIVWLGCNTFDNKSIRQNCGLIATKGRYTINDIPVIRMWHTSSHCPGERLGLFKENQIIDKLAFKLSTELKAVRELSL